LVRVIAERVFTEPLTAESLEAVGRDGQSCLAAYRVRHLRTLLSPDGLRTICEYEAPDAESVRQASTRLGLPFERIWTARVFDSEK
jgi:hypothetical protein